MGRIVNVKNQFRTKRMLLIPGVLLGLFAVFTLFVNIGLPIILSSALSRELGATVRMDQFKVDFSERTFEIKNLNVMQPAGFGDGNMILVPSIKARVHLKELFHKTLHLSDLELSVADVVIVQRKNQAVNTDALKLNVNETKMDGEAAKHPPLILDKVRLTMKRVVFKDLTGDKPKVTARYLKIQDLELNGIANTTQLTTIVLGQTLQVMAIKSALLYGAVAATGVGLIPAAAAMVLTGNANDEGVFDVNYARALNAIRRTIKILGTLNSENIKEGRFNASIDDSNTDIQIIKTDQGRIQISVSSRKMLIPTPTVAAGVLYTIEENF